jgi:hypothetical protein
LVAKSSHTGVIVDEVAYPMHRPTARIHQTMGHGFLPGAILSNHAVMGGGTLLGDTLLSGMEIRIGVGLPGYLCHRVVHRAHCFLIRYAWFVFGSIMVYMHVSLVKLSFQTAMGQVPALEYMLSGVRGLLQLCHILSGNERYRPSSP